MKNRKREIMTHIVAGYPSLGKNRETVDIMASAGVSYVEIQIPFSDPVADGPVILNANLKSLKNGTSLADCFRLCAELIHKYPDVKFLFMSYYNIIFSYGVKDFILKASKAGVWGLIVPDLPPEEDLDNYYGLCRQAGIAPVLVLSPGTPEKRIIRLKELASGIVYSTSRVGITGASRDIGPALKDFVALIKKHTGLPVAVGFGIDSPEKAKIAARFADIIVIGSKIIKITEDENAGENALYNFLLDVGRAIDE